MKPKKLRILVTDDYECALDSTSRILVKRGYQVDRANNGMIAFHKILGAHKKQQQYDLLVTDLMMPEMSGLELIDSTKRLNVNLPVLIITAYRDKRMNVELRKRGFERNVLEKPFSSRELIQAVAGLLVC